MDPKFTILAQLAPGAAAETVLYTVTATEHIIANEIIVCNRGGAGSFRISVSVLGGPTAPKDYFYYNLPILANDTFANDMQLTLNAGDVIRVYASTANLTFTLLGAKT